LNIDSILISEYASLSGQNELTVVRVFNQLAARGFPATHEWLAVSLIIHGHRSERNREHTLELRIAGPQPGQSKKVHEGTFRFMDVEPPPGMPLRHTYVFRMVRVQFPEPGPYAFEVYIDGTYHAASTINIKPLEE
jgi:hypothetical protein